MTILYLSLAFNVTSFFSSFFFFSSSSCLVILAELCYTCIVFMLVSFCTLLFFKVETELFNSDSEQSFKNMMLKEWGNKLENATISTRKSVSHHIIPASLKSPHFTWGPHFTRHNLIDRWIIYGDPLQRSCLENPRDGGAWWAAVYGVAQSRTRLKRLSSSSSK